MTLIQTWVGRTAISQVSDRRLTDPTTGDVKNDIYNKAVSWCGRRAVSFTGLAYIDRRQKEPVSHWIAKILADHHHLQGTSPSGDHVDDHDRGAELVTRRGAAIAVAHSRCTQSSAVMRNLGDHTPPIRDPRDVSCFRERRVAQARTPPR